MAQRACHGSFFPDYTFVFFFLSSYPALQDRLLVLFPFLFTELDHYIELQLRIEKLLTK
jgi:hypothetical protein